MTESRRLSVLQCWEKLQRIDEALEVLPSYALKRQEALTESRKFFELQLARALRLEKRV